MAASMLENKVMSGLLRVGDIITACVLIGFTLPLMAFVGVAIKLDSFGPIFNLQPRTGPDGRTFFVFKFRTTEYDPEWASKAIWDRRARETRVGRFLRYTRIEDLPGIFNVLLGDMRLLGNERIEGDNLRELAKWAAWAAAAAFETLG